MENHTFLYLIFHLNIPHISEIPLRILIFNWGQSCSSDSNLRIFSLKFILLNNHYALTKITAAKRLNKIALLIPFW